VSGLSLGALIVEAASQSGSLITARLAAEQGREIFAVPGNLTVPQSFGPNFLIKQGAKLVQSWRDVVDELPPPVAREIRLREEAAPPGSARQEALPQEAGALLELLTRDEPALFDEVHRRSGIDISRLSALLLDLEGRGRVRQLPGNYYLKT
jgi:DNA processing protein